MNALAASRSLIAKELAAAPIYARRSVKAVSMARLNSEIASWLSSDPPFEVGNVV